MLHIKKVKPMFTALITTGNRFEKDFMEGGILIAKQGDLKLWQEVIAIGDSVRGINIGDKVMINPMNYAKKRYDKNSIQNDLDNNPTLKYEFNWVTIDDENGTPQECLLLNDRDIQYVFEGEETDEPQLIMPKKKKLLIN